MGIGKSPNFYKIFCVNIQFSYLFVKNFLKQFTYVSNYDMVVFRIRQNLIPGPKQKEMRRGRTHEKDSGFAACAVHDSVPVRLREKG